MQGAGFYDVFNRLHSSIELLANDDESGCVEKVCRKAANLCSRQKKLGDEGHFCRTTINPPLFSRAQPSADD